MLSLAKINTCITLVKCDHQGPAAVAVPWASIKRDKYNEGQQGCYIPASESAILEAITKSAKRELRCFVVRPQEHTQSCAATTQSLRHAMTPHAQTHARTRSTSIATTWYGLDAQVCIMHNTDHMSQLSTHCPQRSRNFSYAITHQRCTQESYIMMLYGTFTPLLYMLIILKAGWKPP